TSRSITDRVFSVATLTLHATVDAAVERVRGSLAAGGAVELGGGDASVGQLGEAAGGPGGGRRGWLGGWGVGASGGRGGGGGGRRVGGNRAQPRAATRAQTNFLVAAKDRCLGGGVRSGSTPMRSCRGARDRAVICVIRKFAARHFRRGGGVAARLCAPGGRRGG